MRVLCLIPNQKGYSPGQRGSIELWEKVLEPQGIQLEFAPFETERLREFLYADGRHAAKAFEMVRGYINRIGLLRRLDEFDAVFVYREAALIGPAILERLVARKKPIIYQLDDPLFVPYKSQYNGYFSYLKFFSKVKAIIEISKVVIVNSSGIRQYAENYNKNIWQIPSVVDTGRYKFIPFTEDSDRVCVGWSGSPTTLKNLKMVERPLQRISSKNICDIHFIGGSKLDLREVNFSLQAWNADTEVEDLRKIQIGLVPLPENSWNRYKFIMKTAQYMALGIVPVGTPMASNIEVIRHGENGFLAKNDLEWEQYISMLIQDKKLRTDLSNAASKDALEHYSLAANANNIIAAFKAAVSG